MAGSRQPTDLLLLKGKKHLTKSEIEERKSAEVSAPSDKVRAPSYLSKDLKREFNKLAKELVSIDIMTNLDVDALARFIIARKMYLEVTGEILKNPRIMLVDKDVIMTQDRLFKQCRAAASDLGLTISSRCKLVVPKNNDPPHESKWDKYRAGNSG